MAANFWASTHFKRLQDPEELNKFFSSDQFYQLSVEEIKIIKIHMATVIQGLARQMNLRQRIASTAIVYFHRVYTRKGFKEYDPRIVGPTCLYLAAKAEETTIQAKLLIHYMKNHRMFSVFDMKSILEMEMRLLEALDFYLVVFHPYRPLIQYLKDANQMGMLEMCWSMVNDSYRTNLCLFHPPHMIALGCVYLCCIIQEKDMNAWFEELRVDITTVYNISNELLDFYESYRVIAEDVIHSALSKLPKLSNS